jgi:stearoyl-CoA desaturase (delta-9 desaturase)
MRCSTGQSKTATLTCSYGTIVLFSLVALGAPVAVPVFGYIHGYSWLDWTLFALLYVFTGLGITVGYHRLIAHHSFDCANWVKFSLLIAGGWALENSAIKWASDHIRHHSRCDQDTDPYNAKRGFWYSHCGWIFVNDPHPNEKYGARLRQDPMLIWQHRYYVPIVLSGLALPFVAGFVYNGWMGGLGCFLLAGVARTFVVLNSTFCINSICHLWGKQPHTKADSSRDSWLVSLFTFGEGFHNFHHAHQRDYRNGSQWYNFDPSKWVIFGLSVIGAAWNLCRIQPERTRFVAD